MLAPVAREVVAGRQARLACSDHDRVELVRHRAAASSTDSGGRRLGCSPMCRNIRTLHNFEPPASEDEVRAAALQYVRKISGTTRPSHANEEAFARAVDEVAAASHPPARRARDEGAAP